MEIPRQEGNGEPDRMSPAGKGGNDEPDRDDFDDDRCSDEGGRASQAWRCLRSGAADLGPAPKKWTRGVVRRILNTEIHER